ncbi:3-isopropylmalate dehydratase small subunit [Acidobacteria bacterium ACD]|nr:MAG: 3-isopropylmalate dehydratase small subunit [Acidobacteriota bacterium]MCE7956726.1 3-isopropylmalate dehydratase small subunit [Acidobacteria bacterium ACB2]MDL1948242.1 3-isopropylmalate dehydratase small subunit [Acidobacteria bacterium ACD]
MSAIRVVTGRALPLRGDDVDTDRILPARFLKAVTFEGLGEHAFEDDRRALAGTHPFDRPEHAGASILLVNRNFGCGSSREHAPQALVRRGIRAVVGEGFSEIFFGNAVALGLPCVALPRVDVLRLQDLAEREPGTVFTVDLVARTVSAGETDVAFSMPEAAREAFVTGLWDSLSVLLDRFGEVRAVEARLPRPPAGPLASGRRPT